MLCSIFFVVPLGALTSGEKKKTVFTVILLPCFQSSLHFKQADLFRRLSRLNKNLIDHGLRSCMLYFFFSFFDSFLDLLLDRGLPRGDLVRTGDGDPDGFSAFSSAFICL